MAAETQYTANTGMVTISTANSNLDGTGTLGTVLTAASNGTKVKSITIKARGSTTAQGMVRLFVHNGSNARLFAEVEIPIVTQSGTDACFEKYMEVDLDLKSGWTLRASTQVANNFNIIAEGLDWAYPSGMVRPESTIYVANTGVGVISTANSNLDGTGTVATILTAGASATYKGCLIKSIVIKGTGSTTADGMIRLFVQNTAGSVTTLLTEVPVPIVTQTGTTRSFAHQIDFPGGFNLQAGYKIIASTQNANSFVVTVEADDWRYPSASYVSNYTATSGTNTTTEELLHSLLVPANMVTSGSLISVHAGIATNNNANNKTFRIYVNTSSSLSGATLLATLTTSSSVSDSISRLFPVISDTSLECFGGTTTSIRSPYINNTGTSAAVTVPSVSAGFYIIISGQKALGTDTDTVRWSMMTKVF